MGNLENLENLENMRIWAIVAIIGFSVFFVIIVKIGIKYYKMLTSVLSEKTHLCKKCHAETGENYIASEDNQDEAASFSFLGSRNIRLLPGERDKSSVKLVCERCGSPIS